MAYKRITIKWGDTYTASDKGCTLARLGELEDMIEQGKLVFIPEPKHKKDFDIMFGLDGKKIFEIAYKKRKAFITKSTPKKTPFTVYLYCHKSGYGLTMNDTFCNGKVVGEVVISRVYELSRQVRDEHERERWIVETNPPYYNETENYGITEAEADSILGRCDCHRGSLWVISSTKFYSKPKELGQFKTINDKVLAKGPNKSWIKVVKNERNTF